MGCAMQPLSSTYEFQRKAIYFQFAECNRKAIFTNTLSRTHVA